MSTAHLFQDKNPSFLRIPPASLCPRDYHQTQSHARTETQPQHHLIMQTVAHLESVFFFFSDWRSDNEAMYLRKYVGGSGSIDRLSTRKKRRACEYDNLFKTSFRQRVCEVFGRRTIALGSVVFDGPTRLEKTHTIRTRATSDGTRLFVGGGNGGDANVCLIRFLIHHSERAMASSSTPFLVLRCTQTLCETLFCCCQRVRFVRVHLNRTLPHETCTSASSAPPSIV